MRRLGLFIATCGYIGYAPIAPGTFGSAAGLVVFAAVRSSGSPAVEAAVIVSLFLIGIWSGTEAEQHFGGVDPAPVVMDEVVGMLITLAFLPVTWIGAIVGFLVFRVLDVFKPWPAATIRAVARRPRCDGGRWDGGTVRQSGDAWSHRDRPGGMAGVNGSANGGGRVLTTAAILAVGSELLTPTRLDTNSLFITEQLNSIGIEVITKAVVGDTRDDVIQLFDAAATARSI